MMRNTLPPLAANDLLDCAGAKTHPQTVHFGTG